MHSNRSTYTLPEYQQLLRNRCKKLGIVCENLETGRFVLFHPIPFCPWLPESRKKYFSKLYSRLKNLPADTKYTFCTLTYSSSQYSPEEAASRVKSDLDKFFKRLDYRKSKPKYFYVIELTDHLMVHVHLIFDKFVHKSKIFLSWSLVTNSTSIKIKALSKSNAVAYCIKYLTKSKKMSEDKWKFLFKNIDRLWTISRNFLLSGSSYISKYDFYFLCFNKNFILDFYLGFDCDLETAKDLSPPEAELLYLDCSRENCVISHG